MILDFFLAWIFFFFNFCCLWVAAAAATKVLTLSIRMQKSRAEIIELSYRAYNASEPVCSAATVYIWHL